MPSGSVSFTDEYVTQQDLRAFTAPEVLEGVSLSSVTDVEKVNVGVTPWHKDWMQSFFLIKQEKNEKTNFLKGESEVVLYKICNKKKTCVHCNRRVVGYNNGNASPANHDSVYKRGADPHPSVWRGFERSENLARLDSRLWHGPTNLNTEMCWVSFPAPFLPPRVEFFQCREYNLFLSLFKIMGKIYVSWEGHNFPFDSSTTGTVTVTAFNAAALKISTSSVSVSVGSWVLSLKGLKRDVLHSLAIFRLFFLPPSPTSRGSDFSPKQWAQSNKEKEMENGFLGFRLKSPGLFPFFRSDWIERLLHSAVLEL